MKYKGKSILVKITIYFIELLLVISFLYCLASGVFLQRFYLKSKISLIENTYNRIRMNWETSGFSADSEEFSLRFERYSSKNNLSILILDSALNVVKSSMPTDDRVRYRVYSYIFTGDPNYLFKNPVGSGEMPQAGSGYEYEDRDIYVCKNYRIKMSSDPRMKTDFLELFGNLPNDSYIMVRTPLEPLRDSVKLTLWFTVIMWAIWVVLGGITCFLVANHLAMPIKKLAALSDRMANLDFTVKFEGSKIKELDELGSHMNKMSKVLEKNISDLKTANNELRRDLENRQKLDAMRSEFISNISHELKTPLAIIQGYAEGLKEGINDDPQGNEYYCDVIMDETIKMNRMVKNLLTLNQIEYGQDSVNIEFFDLGMLIRNVISSSQILIDQSGAQIILDIPEKYEVWGDEYLIEMVFINYLTNAVHYVKESEGKKQITVSAKRNEAARCARISVFNTGEPIPEDAISKIWNKFYKVDKARTRAYGGSGVGLSIVKAVMDCHHKEYGVINHEDGVEFYFELEQ